jgi:hypothetical protein
MAMMTAPGGGQRGRAGATALALLVASLSLCAAASAQQPGSANARPWYVTVSHWGKWPLLAGAIGFAAAAIAQKSDADAVYNQLQSMCRAASADCIVGPDGKYVNPDAEGLFQETLRLDGKARRWMLGGEASLALSGGMFLIDLVAGHGEPRNIPFTPFEVYTGRDRLGVQWRF